MDRLPGKVKRIPVLLLLLLLGSLAMPAQTPRQLAYDWKNVQIVGGGFVDGIVFHPTAAGVRYARTDIGGAYRWDQSQHRWQPILDWVSYRDRNLMGVEAIAVDPEDANRVYLACGTYTDAHTPNGVILRSGDGGQTFQRSDLPFKFGGNEDGRGNGERLAVDPRDGRILFLGTRHDGLWRSQDRGATWARVAGFPDVTEKAPPQTAAADAALHQDAAPAARRRPASGDGIVFVKFAPASGQPAAPSPTATIYAGVSLMGRPNLFVSHDGGASWSAIPGEPTQYRPLRAALAGDGVLYLAYGSAPGPTRMTNGAIWKLDTHTGVWTDITPERPVAGSREFGYAAVAVDAKNPRALIASSFGRPRPAGGDELFRSTDGGLSWKPIFASGGVLDSQLAPYVKVTPIHWLFDIEIDPVNPDHAVFTTGYGGWETFDLTAADRGLATHWSALATGIEETVALALVSPSEGAHLVSGIGDYGGFVHWDLDRPALEGSSAPPRMGNTTGVAAAALRPEIVVRVGIDAGVEKGAIGYSIDGGRSWHLTPATPQPDSRAGVIAVSADGGAWIWTPEHQPAYLTLNRGATWTAVRGLPAGLPVVADAVDSQSFYAVSLTLGMLYLSSDRGSSFTAQQILPPADPPSPNVIEPRGDRRGGQDRIYAAPGHAGDLWLAAYDGLYHASPSASAANKMRFRFNRLAGVGEILAFGFGKAAPGSRSPALYLAGTVDGLPGIFRSTDEAHTWVRINDDGHQWGLILQIAGDPRIFGRVYVGTHGRGILYGDPAAKQQ
jgi:photosystem II stability/assembly factor-like uncharacterized protein